MAAFMQIRLIGSRRAKQGAWKSFRYRGASSRHDTTQPLTYKLLRSATVDTFCVSIQQHEDGEIFLLE